MNNKLHVTNLPFTTTEQELQQLFEKFGKITDVILLHGASGRPRGYAFVVFEDEDCAEQARKAMHEQEFNGRQLCVTIAEEERGRTGRW